MRDKNAKVDLDKRTIELDGTEYEWDVYAGEDEQDEEDAYDDDPTVPWFKISKKWVTDGDEKYRVADLDPDIDFEVEGLGAVRYRIKDPKLKKRLNRLRLKSVAKYKKKMREKEQRKKSQRLEKGDDNRSGSRPAVTTGDDDAPKRKEQSGAVNARLKSQASEYELNFRAAPSKKHPGLHNFAVHLGQRLLGFVEVPREEIVEFARQFLALEEDD